jgi:hypothetical protein
MLLCALVTDELAEVSASSLYAPYLLTSLAITFFSLLLSIFWWVTQLAREGAEAPLRTVKERVLERLPYLLLPAVVFPLFLAAFTATKTAIPFLVGYSWDPFWAAADRSLFGDDAWHIVHRLLGSGAVVPLEWFYTMAWGVTLIFVMALVPLNARPAFVARFYSAMMATWLVGGVGIAYLFSAAGPVFAHLATSGSRDQFPDLQAFLAASLPPDSPMRLTQQYLATALHSHVAVKGGGISAMPSMHLGAASIYVIAARRTRWFVPAVLFWTVIFISSGYFGYHYWVDGLVAFGVAGGCWILATRVLSILGNRSSAFRLRAPALVVTQEAGRVSSV